MSWLDKILPPKIKNRSSSSSVPEGLWHKCPSCSATVYSTELKQNSEVCPKCNHHNPLSAARTFESTFWMKKAVKRLQPILNRQTR